MAQPCRVSLQDGEVRLAYPCYVCNPELNAMT